MSILNPFLKKRKEEKARSKLRRLLWLWARGLMFLALIYILTLPISLEHLLSSKKIFFCYILICFVVLIGLCLFCRKIIAIFTEKKFWRNVFPILLLFVLSVVVGWYFFFLNKFYLLSSLYISLLHIFPLSF